MTFRQRLEKFKYPLNGFRIAWLEEASFRFQIVFAFFTILFAYLLKLSIIEFLIVIGMVGIVIVAELFNTALEELCDKFQPTHDPHVAKIKDLAAAAVLASSITALVIGFIIFIPHAITLFTV